MMADPNMQSKSFLERVHNTAPWAAGLYAAYKLAPLAQALDQYAGRSARALLAGYGGLRGAGSLAGLAGGPVALSALTAAAVMDPVEANAGEVPYYTIDPLTGRYGPNPALHGATPPGGTPPGGSSAPAPVAPNPAAPPAQVTLPFAGPHSDYSGQPHQLMQSEQEFMRDQGTSAPTPLAGGSAPAWPQATPPPPQAAPQPAAGYYGGSPETNPNLRPVDQPTLDFYGPSVQKPGPSALLQKLIEALGGVTNGGPLSPIGNLNPGKFGGL
jgi:hypothetical protein